MFKYLILLLFLCNISFAKTNDIVRHHENNIRNLEIQRNKQDLKPDIKSKLTKPKIPLNEIKEDLPCFDIKQIILKDVTILSEEEQFALKAPYLNKCINITHINNLIKEITNFYIENAYITSRASLVKQNLKSGKLIIQIIEGKINNIKLEGAGSIKNILPNVKDKILNLRDIEQGLEQLNKLPSNNINIAIEAAEKFGYSNITITNKQSSTNNINIKIDNSGSKSTNRNVINYSFEKDNLLNLNDQLKLIYSTNLDYDPQNYSKSYNANFSIPYGYWTLSSNINHLEYKNKIKLEDEVTLDLEGTNDIYNFNIDRIIFRNEDSTVKLNSEFTHKISNNSSNGFVTDVNSKKLSILGLGLEYQTQALNAIWSFFLNYHKGIGVLNANSDLAGIDNPKARFDKISTDIYVYKPFSLFDQSFSYNANLAAQLTNDPLHSSEQINIGGRYSVRGFNDDSIIADNGVYLHNDISWNIDSKWNIKPYIGFDIGYGSSKGGKDLNEYGTGYLTGAAIGLKKSSKWFDFDISYGKAINAPESIKTNSFENYFALTAKMRF